MLKWRQVRDDVRAGTMADDYSVYRLTLIRYLQEVCEKELL